MPPATTLDCTSVVYLGFRSRSCRVESYIAIEETTARDIIRFAEMDAVK